MTDFEPEEDLPPVAHVTLVYNGPVAPHWEMKTRYGDQKMLDDFWTRVNARLLLLPKHDPQFRRNRERVNRDAERELIICDWDLGDDDAESTSTEVVVPAETAQAEETAEDTVDEDGTENAAEAPAEASSADEPEAEGVAHEEGDSGDAVAEAVEPEVAEHAAGQG
jgi:hypothetical protein